MNKLYTLFLIAFFMILSNAVFAQKGTIRGTVIDDKTGEPLYGVTVMAKGTSMGEATDFEGKFDISLPAGTYDLRISYVSYQSVTIEAVKVTAGEVTVFDTIRLKKAVEEMEEVVVTAETINISEAAMLTKKKKSPNFLDGISAEKFTEVGVSDAAGALKKVTGVSVQGGKYVYVRGLGDRYTKTMLNSVEIPSLDPNRNSLQIDIFPTNLIDNIVISKTAVADMPASFTGGIVNIKTKDFPEEPIFEISGSLGYNPNMHFNSNFLTYPGSETDFLGYDGGARKLPDGAGDGNIPTPISGASGQEVYNFINSFNPVLGPRQSMNMMDYSLGTSFGNQYEIGENNSLGLIFSGTYKKSTNHYDNYQYGEYQTQSDPSQYDLVYATKQNGSLSETNVLLGGLAGVAFKTQNSKLRLTGMHLQKGESRASNFFIDNSGSAVGQSGYIADSYNLEYSERRITNLLLNGVHYFDKSSWEVDWRISPTVSRMSDPDIRRTTFTLVGSNRRPTFSAGAGGFPSRIWRKMDEINLSSRLDITRNYNLFDEPATFKFGGSYVYKQRDYEILSYNMAFFGNPPNVKGDPSEILKDENIYDGTGGTDGTIYYQSANPTPNPNAYNSNVNNTAFYLSNEFTLFSKLKMNFGIRAEKYVQRHTGRDARYAQGGNGNNLENEKVLDALDLFPSANMTYLLSDNQNLRLAYSKTIARPSFKELSFAQILDPVSDRIFNGGLFPIGEWDGNLNETRIHNIDIRWERYYDRQQMISASLFYKSFDDPIELVRIQVQQTSSEFQPRNVGHGQVFGAEFELRKNLGFISPTFKNLCFSSNVTLLQSTIKMTQQEYEARKRREKKGQNIDHTRQMADQAPYIINAGLSYDNPEIGLNGGLFYNVKGRTMVVVGGGLYPDVYSEPFHNLKFNLNKSFGLENSYTVNVSVSNILNDSKKEFYKGFRSEKKVFSSYAPHRSISVGIKYSF